MASDWGSAFAGQEVNYVIAFRNTQKTGDLKNVQIASSLPANLQILGQKSDVGEPQVQGNLVTLKLAALAPDKGVEIAIRAKIRDNIEAGTRLVSQAEATYDGLVQPLRSNVVTVLIVGSPGPVAQAATPASSATAAATPAPATPTSTALPSATLAATSQPVATVAPTSKPAPELPNTSTGVPISGFALLGLTLLLRTVRLHRSQTRI